MLEKKGIRYRVGTKDDLIAITMFCKHIPKGSQILTDLELDLAKGNKALAYNLDSNKGVCLIAEDVEKDRLVGVTFLGETTLWWSNKKFLTNALFYVDPNYRKGYGGVAKTMLEAVKTVSKESGMPVLLDIVNNEGLNDLMTKFYEQNGFKNIGFKVLYTP